MGLPLFQLLNLLMHWCYHHQESSCWLSFLYIYIWSNYSDLTRPHPKWWFSKGNPLISGKSRLVKYYNLARYIHPGKLTYPLKIDGWKMMMHFPLKMVPFEGTFVHFRWEYTYNHLYSNNIFQRVDRWNPTWRIIPFSKWLITPIYKP